MFKLSIFNWEGDEPPVSKVQSSARCAWKIILRDDKKYAVIEKSSGDLIDGEYDNAFYYGWTAVVLCKEGWWGAMCLLDDEGDRIARIACEWDTVEALNWDLLFSRSRRYLFYHDATRRAWEFKEVSAHGPDDLFLFGETSKEYLLLDRSSGEIIWTDSQHSPRYHLSAGPCLTYMGMREGLPVFYDATYSRWLVPEGGRLVWQDEPPRSMPCVDIDAIVNPAAALSFESVDEQGRLT